MNNQTYTANYCQQMTSHILAELDAERMAARDRFDHLGDGPATDEVVPYTADELAAIHAEMDAANRRYLGFVRVAYGEKAE
jgi:hypothetical protein